MEYRFSIFVGEDVTETSLSNSLYEAGFDDATLAIMAGRPRIMFTYDSPTLEIAVLDATKRVKAAQLTVTGLEIDPDELSEIEKNSASV